MWLAPCEGIFPIRVELNGYPIIIGSILSRQLTVSKTRRVYLHLAQKYLRCLNLRVVCPSGAALFATYTTAERWRLFSARCGPRSAGDWTRLGPGRRRYLPV
jgi:hypothetical protein